MKYPSDPKTWYMYCSAGYDPHKEVPEGRKRKLCAAFVCINRKDSNMDPFELGAVQLDSPTFADDWEALVQKGKKKIDALLLDPNVDTMAGTTQCANCDGMAQEDDFLCRNCRKNT